MRYTSNLIIINISGRRSLSKRLNRFLLLLLAFNELVNFVFWSFLILFLWFLIQSCGIKFFLFLLIDLILFWFLLLKWLFLLLFWFIRFLTIILSLYWLLTLSNVNFKGGILVKKAGTFKSSSPFPSSDLVFNNIINIMNSCWVGDNKDWKGLFFNFWMIHDSILCLAILFNFFYVFDDVWEIKLPNVGFLRVFSIREEWFVVFVMSLAR